MICNESDVSYCQKTKQYRSRIICWTYDWVAPNTIFYTMERTIFTKECLAHCTIVQHLGNRIVQFCMNIANFRCRAKLYLWCYWAMHLPPTSVSRKLCRNMKTRLYLKLPNVLASYVIRLVHESSKELYICLIPFNMLAKSPTNTSTEASLHEL